MVMKGALPLLLVLVLGMIGVGGIIYFTGINLIGRAELITINGQSVPLVRPLFGYYKCDIISHTDTEFYSVFKSDATTYVDCKGSSQTCEIKASCDYGIYVLYQRDGSNGECEINNAQNQWCDVGVSGNGVYHVDNLQNGQRMRVGRCTNALYYGSFNGKLYRTYDSFGLVTYKPSGGYSVLSTSCMLMSFPNNAVITNCRDMKNLGSTDIRCVEEATSSMLTGGLKFYQSVNYLDIMVDVPKYGNVQIYNGQDAICMPGVGQSVDLYSIGLVDTTDGTYAMPKLKLGTEDCCNGQAGTPGYVCQNWKWVSVGNNQTTGCVGTWQCYNAGNWYNDPTAPNYKQRQECQNGQCVIAERLLKQCDSNNPCPLGYNCNPTTFLCERDIKPVQCGDGICDQNYENAQNCPSDCNNPWLESLLDFVVWMVIGTVIGFIIMGALVVLTPLKFLLARGWKFIIFAALGIGVLIALLAVML